MAKKAAFKMARVVGDETVRIAVCSTGPPTQHMVCRPQSQFRSIEFGWVVVVWWMLKVLTE